MAESFECFSCERVYMLVNREGDKCPSCGGANGQPLSQETVAIGMESGVYFNVAPVAVTDRAGGATDMTLAKLFDGELRKQLSVLRRSTPRDGSCNKFIVNFSVRISRGPGRPVCH
jgi:hypothetical protein